MVSDSGYSEEELSALGTVMQSVVQRRRMTSRMGHKERLLLNACLQLGLSAPDFYAVRKICELAGWFTPALLSLLLCERLACSQGSTYLSLEPESLGSRLVEMGIEERDTKAIFAKIPDFCREAPGLFADHPDKVTPFIITDKTLYRQRHLVAEREINEAMDRMTARPWSDYVRLAEVYEQVTRTEPLGTRAYGDPMRRNLTLAHEQQLAALVAVCAPLTVISGGPGTGKTSIVVTILRLLAGLGANLDKIALAAPTGRAANRMGEALRKGLRSVHPDAAAPLMNALPEPHTLHRLLGWRPGDRSFRYNRGNTLDYECLIVDEGSMIDLMMMENLLTAMPDGARLILLGDAHQLPSVEAGAVFRDLSLHPDQCHHQDPLQTLQALRDRGPGIRSIHLTRSFRQQGDRGGQHVLHLSKMVNAGRKDQLFECGEQPIHIHEKGSSLPWNGVCLVDPSRMSINNLVSHIYGRFLEPCRSEAGRLTKSFEGNHLSPGDLGRLGPLFDLSEKMRILCLTHKSLHGVERLNSMLHDRYSEGREGFKPGLPWMVTHNDYQRDLYNGDIGLGIETGDEDSRHQFLVFRHNDGFRETPFDSINGLQQAFAMTVHKSQGSETDHVVLILPEKINPLCKREVIYTGLTRARKSVLIYGSRELLEEAVTSVMERVTGLLRKKTKGEP